MAGLISDLLSASSSLAAQQYALETVGQNIANAGTTGYTRRTVDLEAVPQSASDAGGVVVSQVRALRDLFLETRLNQEGSARQYSAAMADSLSEVEASFGQPGTSIDGQLSSFFDAFATLAQDPTSAIQRNGVVVQAQQLAASFNTLADELSDARAGADQQIRATVQEINTLADRAATLNAAISGGNGADVNTLRDELGAVVAELSEKAGVVAMQRADGGLDLSIGSGRLLVMGGSSYALEVSSVAPDGLADVTLTGASITSELQAGTIGGLLQVRDTVIPGYQSSLDDLAFAVADEVNTLHQAGFDLDGAAGGDFFSPLATATGAAAALAVAGAIVSDHTLIAASSTGAQGDNQTAAAIAALRDARVLGGGTSTFVDEWSTLVYQVGSDAKTANESQQMHEAMTTQVQRLRDAVSGVSMDEEAANMMKFSRAYEAIARYFQAVQQTLDTLLHMV